MKDLIPNKTYRCVFCGERMAGSKFVEHAKAHAGVVHAITPPDAKTWNELERNEPQRGEQEQK